MPFKHKLAKRLALMRASGVGLAVAAFACTADRSISGPPSFDSQASSQSGQVLDLKVTTVNQTSVSLSFTEVDDGTGQPASYDVRYAVGALSWGSAPSVTSGTCATPVVGSAIGNKRSCTVLGLTPATGYQFQLIPFRGTLNMGTAVFGSVSNVASGTTAALDPPPVASSVASVTVSPASASVSVGQTVQLTATPKDANGTALTGAVVTWSSNNAAVATVSGSGLVTAVAAGSVTSTATSGGISGPAAITVTAPVSTTPGTVTDLAVAGVTDTSLTLSFTEVDDGTGQPASYDVRYAVGALSWGSAPSVTRETCATPLAGSAIGNKRTCTHMCDIQSPQYHV